MTRSYIIILLATFTSIELSRKEACIIDKYAGGEEGDTVELDTCDQTFCPL